MTELSDLTPIVLVGLMGSGKSTVGRLVAKQLGRPFVDLDDLVAERAGRSVAEVFATDGEAGFRRLESSALARALTRTDGPVVATGGGVVTVDANRDLLVNQTHVVWLRALPATLAARTASDVAVRPLLADAERAEATLSALHQERAPHYAQVATSVIDTDGLDGSAVAAAIVDQLVVRS
jgi:shikimate kinase